MQTNHIDWTFESFMECNTSKFDFIFCDLFLIKSGKKPNLSRQFKLDILKFTQDRFSTIVWMDSDTLVHNDITDFLVQFIKQKVIFLVIFVKFIFCELMVVLHM